MFEREFKDDTPMYVDVREVGNDLFYSGLHAYLAVCWKQVIPHPKDRASMHKVQDSWVAGPRL